MRFHRGTLLRFSYGYGRVEAQEGGLGAVRVGFGAAHHVGEGQLPVLLRRGEAEVLAAEEDERVEEDDGGVRPQLFTVPEELLLHAGVDVTCGAKDRLDVNLVRYGFRCKDTDCPRYTTYIYILSKF